MISVYGRLDLHGSRHNVTWTRLAETVIYGANLIRLSEPVDWRVGDEIVVTTTDTNIAHSERHSIARLENSTIIHTNSTFAYTHTVIRHTFPNRQSIEIAAAVGLLTRNVRVTNNNPASSLAGTRIFISEYQPFSSTYYRGFARLSNVQFAGFGLFEDTPRSDQKAGIYLNRLGDYNVNRPTYVDACSFDGGYNTAYDEYQWYTDHEQHHLQHVSIGDCH
jgi:hypothetical protein